MTSHLPEIEELLGAYALDAVDPDERALMEDHLATCPRCRAELADHREVAALLGNLPEPTPDRLWDRIEEALDTRGHAVDTELFRRVGGLTAPAPLPRPSPPPALQSDGAGRAPSRRRWLLAGLAAAASVVLIAGLAVVVVRQDRRIDDLSGQVARYDVERAASHALADPANTQVRLRSEKNPTLSATAVVEPGGDGYLVSADLPALPSDRTYQLWGLRGEQAISLGVLGASPGSAAFSTGTVGDFTGFAITDEVAGGVPASRNPPVVVGTR